jgi:hypothetical protein
MGKPSFRLREGVDEDGKKKVALKEIGMGVGVN